MAKAAKVQKEPVKLTVKQILTDLDNGLDRREIATKYGLTFSDVKRMFKHDALKGKKVKSAPGFELIEDGYEAPKKEAAPVATSFVAPEVENPTPAQLDAHEVTNPAQNEEETPAPTVTETIQEEPAAEVQPAQEDESQKGVW